MFTDVLPGLRRLRSYRGEWLRADIVAGVVLAAYLLPAAIGDASLAGLSPEAGLYSCLFAGLVFWLFCSSQHTAVTVTSAISLLVGTSLAEMAAGDPARHAALAAATALVVAVLGLAAWLLRAGSLVSFISETVMTAATATSGSGWATSCRTSARRTPRRSRSARPRSSS
jgi:SulP family sulfate permease